MNFFITTKLHRPQIAENHLHRQHLLDHLDQRRYRPLTLVSAPAGYGKTTLVSCWLETCDVLNAWVSLDKNDNDPYLFLSYLINAIQNLFPHKLLKTNALLNGANLPPDTVLKNSLVNELGEIDEPFILALDDFHFINEEAVHQFITTLLQYPPDCLHLVIISRHDPPLQLVSLRGRSQMTEIRAKELRFSKEEAKELLSQVSGMSLDTTTAAMLTEKTEGWVTGLRLTALSLRSKLDIKQKLSALPEKSRYVMDYIVTEVVDQQPVDIQAFLLKTSILKRFCGPLCSAVAGVAEPDMDNRKFLRLLQKHNIFIVHLDDEHQWFRYHRLFQTILYRILRRRTSAKDIAVLHIRAGIWLGEHGFVEESLHHLIKGGDVSAAGDVLTRYRHKMMNEENWQMLGRHLQSLPDYVVKKNPGLLMAQAWLMQNRAQINSIAPLVDQAQALIKFMPEKSNAKPSLKSELCALQGYLAYLTADAQIIIENAQLALNALPEDWSTIRGATTMLLSGGHQMAGNVETAKAILYEALIPGHLKDKAYRIRLLTALCFINWLEADLKELRQAAEACWKISSQYELPESIAISQYFLGICHYYGNEPAEAVKVLSKAVKAPYSQNGLNFMGCIFILALALEAMGQFKEADEWIKHHNIIALETGNKFFLDFMKGFRADLDLRRGHMGRARHWADSYDPYPLVPMTRCYLPQLTKVKILLSRHTGDSLHEADELIKNLQTYYTGIHNRWFLIELFALEAILYDQQGDGARAMKALEHSVRLAQPGGVIRLFVDHGPKMAGLLRRLGDSLVSNQFLDKLLAAFGDKEDDREKTGTTRITQSATAFHWQTMGAYLTKREIEILKNLAEGLSNTEISDKLYISPETVKKHLYNIYKKLTVKNRHQAILEAKSLGIL